MSPTIPHPTTRRTALALAAALAAATLLLYEPLRTHGFVLADDLSYVARNPHVRGGLSWSGLVWALTSFHAANWHPLTWLSHMLDVSLFGMDAGAQHLVGAALHATTCALLLLLLWRMTGAPWTSAFAAAFVALHPLRVESVAWIAERKDQLAALLFVLTVAAWVGWVRRGGRGRYLLALATFAFGLMAKPMLVTLPLVLWLLDDWPLARTSLGRRRRVVEKLPFVALAGASAVLTVLAQRAGGAIGDTERFPPLDRLANAALSCLAYLRQTAWPRGLTLHYPHPAASADGQFAWLGAAAVVALAAITAVASRLRRVTPAPWVGWLWYLAMLLPVLGIVQVGSQAHADRYTYLPSIGLAIAVAWGGAALVRRHATARGPVAVAGVVVLLAWTALTARQIGVWRDSLTLFSHAVQVAPDDVFSRVNLGAALLDAGRSDAAERELRAALRLDPRSAPALYNLGNLLRERGDDAGAEAAYRRALRSDPGSASIRVNLGLLLLDRGATDEATPMLCGAADLAPDRADAAVDCANALALGGDDDGAERLYRRALALLPGDPPASVGLAGVLLRSGRRDECLRLLDDLLAREPSMAEAHYLRGLALEREGRLEEARAEYRETLRLAPGHAGAARRLAS